MSGKIKLCNGVIVEAGKSASVIQITQGDKTINITATVIGEMIEQNKPGDVFNMNKAILRFLMSRVQYDNNKR